jgi:broad specificity phosphatase PhoE
MRIILVRHGETEWNRLGFCQGVTDIGLNDTGRLQASLLAESLRECEIAAVYSSDLKRAYETAGPVAALHNLEVKREPKLREMNQGYFEGLPFAEIRKTHGEFLKRWRSEPESVRIPGGETLKEVQERVFEIVWNLGVNHEGENVVVVSHNFAISTFLCKVMGLSLREFATFRLRSGCKNLITFVNGRFRVEWINDVRHLCAMEEVPLNQLL